MAGVQLGPAHRALLVEACRLVDRLDGYERVLSGRDWFRDRYEDDGSVTVSVDGVLAEARQTASALKVIVAQLESRPKAAVSTPAQPKGGGLADLTARIAARRGHVPAG